MEKRVGSGLSLEDAWNETSIELVQAAEAHCRALIVKNFAETVRAYATISKELKQVMLQLCELYAVHSILKRLGDFLRASIYLDMMSLTIILTENFLQAVFLFEQRGCS